MDATEISAAGSIDDVDTGLAPLLTAIEGQPLEDRAVAYTDLHDQLRARLEGADMPVTARR